MDDTTEQSDWDPSAYAVVPLTGQLGSSDWNDDAYAITSHHRAGYVS